MIEQHQQEKKSSDDIIDDFTLPPPANRIRPNMKMCENHCETVHYFETQDQNAKYCDDCLIRIENLQHKNPQKYNSMFGNAIPKKCTKCAKYVFVDKINTQVVICDDCVIKNLEGNVEKISAENVTFRVDRYSKKIKYNMKCKCGKTINETLTNTDKIKDSECIFACENCDPSSDKGEYEYIGNNMWKIMTAVSQCLKCNADIRIRLKSKRGEIQQCENCNPSDNRILCKYVGGWKIIAVSYFNPKSRTIEWVDR